MSVVMGNCQLRADMAIRQASVANGGSKKMRMVYFQKNEGMNVQRSLALGVNMG